MRLLLTLFLLAAVTQPPASLAFQPSDPPSQDTSATHPQARPYAPDRDAQSDVANALQRAKAEHKIAVIVLGANWCHDSIGLAGWLETPRIKDMMQDRYVLTFVDVGRPQTGDGRNLDIAKRFGIKQTNTPLVLMVSGDGERLNSRKDAKSWRNAASRSGDAIFDYFNGSRPQK